MLKVIVSNFFACGICRIIFNSFFGNLLQRQLFHVIFHLNLRVLAPLRPTVERCHVSPVAIELSHLRE